MSQPASMLGMQAGHAVPVVGTPTRHGQVSETHMSSLTAYPSTMNRHQVFNYNRGLSSHHSNPSWSSTSTTATASSSTSDRLAYAHRTIHISGLPYDIPNQQIQALLVPFGKVENFQVPRDMRNRSRGRGIAIAKFMHSQEAQRAKTRLDGYCVGGRRLKVKFDRDEDIPRNAAAEHVGRSRPSSRPRRSGSTVRQGPLVVNGARGTVRRRNRDDDSSDSEDDSDGGSGQESSRATSSDSDVEGKLKTLFSPWVPHADKPR